MGNVAKGFNDVSIPISDEPIRPDYNYFLNHTDCFKEILNIIVSIRKRDNNELESRIHHNNNKIYWLVSGTCSSKMDGSVGHQRSSL